MPEDVKSCPLCGNASSRFFDRRQFRELPVINRLCLGCGLVYQSPRMTTADAEAFYAREYRLLYEGDADPTSRNLAVQQARAGWLASFLQGRVTTVERHLDIGCSSGTLLLQFQGLFHCLSTGVEPGEGHRNQARQAGLQVFASLQELEQHQMEKFDLVSLVHVLEHLPDPGRYLTDLRRSILAQGGWLLLEVPNLYCHDSFEIAHLVSYTAHTLTQVLRKSGFEVVHFAQHGQPRSKLLPLYLTVLAQPAAGEPPAWQVVPEKNIGLKRRLGMLQRRLLERLVPKKAWIS
jgi:SAM-dependent methyltransferase